MEHETRTTNHLQVYLVWPLGVGLALAFVLALSVAGVMVIADASNWRAAAQTAGGVFFVVLGVATVAVFVFVLSEWRGPRQVERIERARQTVVEIPAEQPPPRFIPMRGRPARTTTPPPAIPSTAEERGLIAGAIGVLADRMKRRARVTTYHHEVDTLEPNAPAWVREMYQVIITSWPDHLTRREWQGMFTNGTALWSRYVNGDGTGRHAGRGILDVWGCIERADGRGGWRFCHDLATIFSLDADLARYAEERARMVDHSPTRDDLDRDHDRVGTKPNRTERRTENQLEVVHGKV